MLFSMASMGLPMRCKPLSIIRATGLSVFLARERAALHVATEYIVPDNIHEIGIDIAGFADGDEAFEEEEHGQYEQKPKGIIRGRPGPAFPSHS